MFPGNPLLLLGLGLYLCLTTLAATAAGAPARDFPPTVDSYHDQQSPSIFEKLAHRIQREPLNLVATIIFFAAIIHTFLTAQFRKIAHRYQRRYEAIEELFPGTARSPDSGREHDKLIFRAQLFYFMGEVEAVFGIWLVPLFVAIIAFHGWSTMVNYVGQVNVGDAIFVVVIMAMASSLPILRFTETMIGATILTAFNDNAAVTYLASLVPGFSDALKYVVMAGAVTGGGLTVIANSPNPAGQSILASRFGELGVSPLYLFLGALAPTLIDGAAFLLLP